MADILELIESINEGDYATASVGFEELMANKINSKLNDRTKEMAAQLFGQEYVDAANASEVEEDVDFDVEDPDEDDEVAAHLQTLVDDTLAEIEEESGEVNLDEFTESFQNALEAQGLEEKYALWRPTENGAKKNGVASLKVKKKVAKEKSQKRDSQKSRGMREDVEYVTELKARTLRHYVGHAEKQIKSAEDEVRKGKAQGKGEVVKHFTDRIAKRKAGIKTVLGRQKDSAAERAASATAKMKEADKKSKALDGKPKKAAKE